MSNNTTTTVLRFSCKLLSDIVITQSAASEGNQKSLDFIPGSNFLGIVAAEYDTFAKNGTALDVFHSGKVRFGDAHPGYNGERSLRVPTVWFRPKLKNESDEIIWAPHLINGTIEEIKKTTEKLKELQLKQERSGFYIFTKDNKAIKIDVDTNFSMKSGYDSQNRRSKDAVMFGYEAITRGVEMIFEIEIDSFDKSEKIIEDIQNAIVGEKQVGRSRSAQYGKVDIKLIQEEEEQAEKSNENLLYIYTDGRLIFLDKDDGVPTFIPTLEHLELTDGEILWDKSQIRTFQYAPWNAKRKARDADRCGIEKGSVIVVKGAEGNIPSYIGSYKNEGFGKVIINPLFLEGSSDGVSNYVFYKMDDHKKEQDLSKIGTKEQAIIDAKAKEEAEKQAIIDALMEAEPIIKYLVNSKTQSDNSAKIYELVTEYIKKYLPLFIGEENDKFAAQWGKIRAIASRTKQESMKTKLIDGYLSKGVATDKWNKKGRIDSIEDFRKKSEEESVDISQAIVSLATAMGKFCTKKIEKR